MNSKITTSGLHQYEIGELSFLIYQVEELKSLGCVVQSSNVDDVTPRIGGGLGKVEAGEWGSLQEIGPGKAEGKVL